MGDFRASIKISFEMGDFKDSTDMWINWSPTSSDYPGIDQRVLDFFTRAGEQGEASVRASFPTPERNPLKEIRHIANTTEDPAEILARVRDVVTSTEHGDTDDLT